MRNIFIIIIRFPSEELQVEEKNDQFLIIINNEIMQA